MAAPALHHKTRDDLRYFLSCDWGTSSFRLKLVKIKSATIIAGISNDQGTKRIYDQWLEAEKSQDRISYYCSFLNKQIDDLQKKCTRRIDEVPLVISGMASSSIGMQELPYGTLPLSLDSPDIPVEIFDAIQPFLHNIYLISGLRSSNDVMRGEETGLVGLFSNNRISNGLYLLAGTHSKHVIVENSSVINFKTFMTGELFDLLSSKSILSNSVSTESKNGPGLAFEKGVSGALKGNIMHKFFTIRSRDLLDQTDPAENYEYLSGLLIGAELNDIPNNYAGEIVLAGSERLQKYYAAALNILNLSFISADASIGENSIPLGQLAILNQLRS